MKLKANEFITDDQRWDANVYEIKSGATVTLRDKSEDNQPHSLSLIKAAEDAGADHGLRGLRPADGRARG